MVEYYILPALDVGALVGWHHLYIRYVAFSQVWTWELTLFFNPVKLANIALSVQEYSYNHSWFLLINN